MLQKLQKMLPAAVLADDNFSQWKTISTFQELNAFVHRWLPALETQAQTSRKTSFMLNYLQEHCADENVLDDLSQTLQMNREYLSKLLKKKPVRRWRRRCWSCGCRKRCGCSSKTI